MKNFFDMIQDYLDGTLSSAETVAFEQALKTDKALATELAFYKNLEKGIVIGSDYGLRNTVKNVHSGLKNQGFFLTESDIDLYIDDNLDAAKLEGFNFRLSNDIDFANTVQLQKDIIKGIEIGADTDLRNTVKAANESYFGEKTAVVRSLNTEGVRKIGFNWWAAAASVALLITLGIWYLSPSKSITYSDITAQYFQVENEKVKDIYAELSADGFAADKARNNSLKLALDAYQKQNYNEVKTLLEKHLLQYKDDFDAQFYLSDVYIALNEKEKAIPFLENLLKSTSTWMSDAKWNLALIYWNMPEKHAVSVAYLTNIAENKDSKYQFKAKEILKNKN